MRLSVALHAATSNKGAGCLEAAGTSSSSSSRRRRRRRRPAPLLVVGVVDVGGAS